jgi:putative DNA primase/helicase
MLEQIISAMQSEGFQPPSDVMIDDGRLRRFKRTPSDNGKDCWVVLYRFNDRQGGVSHVCVWGDWHDCGEIHKYSTLSGGSSEDRALIRKQIEKAQSKAHEDEERDRAELRQYCPEYMLTLGHEITEYAKVKRLTTVPYSDNGDTIIPVTDGTIVHGYQIIQPDGHKRFKLHTAKKGHFYQIGEPTQRIWMSEGWATGQTVHEATGECVIVCFDAGNVESVVPVIRRAHPRSELFLAGDNDEAGRKINLTGYFPETTGNDWNDEYQAKGIEYVRNQLCVKKQEPIRCLGFKGDTYFYTSETNKQIVSFTASSHSNNNLLNLMPLEWWAAQFPNPKNGVDWSKAYSWMMQSCRGKGIFSPKNIRGTGVWEDQGLRVNCGYQVHPFDPLGRYTYVISDEVPPPSQLATTEDINIMIDVIQSLSWKNEHAWKLFAGWLIVAPFSGLLQWRPHMWLTGGAGAGKSTVTEEIASDILGPYKLYMRGATTEAGIRQSMAHNALPILFDEFETTDKKTGEKNKSVLDLLRQASSESTSEIIKGSSGGDAIQYSPKFCALVTSIRTTLENDADLSRFTVVELSQDKKPDFSRIKGLFSSFDNAYAVRMFSHTYSKWEAFKRNQEALWKMLDTQYNARFAQQYSTLLAGYSLLSGEDAQTIYNGFDFSQFSTVEAERDQYECLNALIGKIIQVEIRSHKVSLSIHEIIRACLVEGAGDGYTFEEKRDCLEPTLQRYGIKISLGTDNANIYIRHSHPELQKLFQGTKWVHGWARSLSRLPDAIYKSTATIMGVKCSCVSIHSADVVYDSVK